jgi:hypothetical protein
MAGDSANYVSRTRLNDATLSTTTNQLQILGATKDSGDNAITQSHVVWVVRIANHLLTNRTTGV